MNRNWLVIGALVLVVGVPLALKLSHGSARRPVETERAQLRVLTPTILASGTLTYESQVTLVPEIMGRVQDVLVKEGAAVKQGELLLRLDPAASQAEVAQIEAAIRQSQLNIERQQVNYDAQVTKWKRYQQLEKAGIVEATKYDDFVTQRDMALVELRTSKEMLTQTQAQLKQARERLAKTEIRSPIAGKITSVSIKAGETAVPSAMSIAGSTLMTVADTSSYYAEVNVDETDVARAAVGLTAKIVPAAFPDKSMTGHVEQVAISPKQTPGQNKSYALKIRLDATDGVEFHPGMSCRAEIVTSRTNGEKTLAVPVQAVRYEDAAGNDAKPKASLFVVDAGRVVKREVETGTADDAYVAILKGLKENDEVVVGPTKEVRFLSDGERVEVKNPPAGPLPRTPSGSSS